MLRAGLKLSISAVCDGDPLERKNTAQIRHPPSRLVDILVDLAISCHTFGQGISPKRCRPFRQRTLCRFAAFGHINGVYGIWHLNVRHLFNFYMLEFWKLVLRSRSVVAFSGFYTNYTFR